MLIQTRVIGSPLGPGKTSIVFKETAFQAGTAEVLLAIDCDSVLVSLWVESISSGSLTVQAFTTVDDSGTKDVEIISFPVVTAPTVNLLLEKAALSMSLVKIRVTATGTCAFDIRAKGITAGEASVRIQGNTAWQTSKVTVTNTPAVLLASSLSDRNGLVIKNWSTTATVFLADSLAKLASNDSYPLAPRDAIAMDLAAGASVYAVADSPTADVRIAEGGG